MNTNFTGYLLSYSDVNNFMFERRYAGPSIFHIASGFITALYHVESTGRTLSGELLEL